MKLKNYKTNSNQKNDDQISQIKKLKDDTVEKNILIL